MACIREHFWKLLVPTAHHCRMANISRNQVHRCSAYIRTLFFARHSNSCYRHTCSRDHYICSALQRQYRQWHKNRTSTPAYRRTIHHRMCWDDSAKFWCLLPLPIAAILCCVQSCRHSDVLRATKKQCYRTAMAKCHCIRSCTELATHFRPSELRENRADHKCFYMLHCKIDRASRGLLASLACKAQTIPVAVNKTQYECMWYQKIFLMLLMMFFLMTKLFTWT